jgi:hypothetical protein
MNEKPVPVILKTSHGSFNAGERVGLPAAEAAKLVEQGKARLIQFVVVPPEEQPTVVPRDGRTDDLVVVRKPAHELLDAVSDAELDEIFGSVDDLDEDNGPRSE